MDRTLILSAAILVGFAVNTTAGDQSLDFSGFSKIDAGKGVAVKVVVGPEFSVAVGADDERALERLDIVKRGDTLQISQETTKGFAWGLVDLVMPIRAPAQVTVTMPSLASLTAHSGAGVEARGKINGDLWLAAASGAEMSLAGVEVETLSLTATSGAEVSLDGACLAANIAASTGAEIDASDFVCGSLGVEATSGAAVEAHAETRLIAKADFGGDIKVFGNPAVTDIAASLSGDVDLRD